MIEIIENLPDGVFGARAIGEVSADDYENTLIPAVDAATAGDEKARMLFVLGPDFEGYQAGAAADDARMGMHHWSDFDRIAVVTDHSVYRGLIKGFGFLMPGEVKVFDVGDEQVAVHWLAS